MAQHYGYEPVSGVHLDGRPYLGENLVDLVGATLALDALRLRAVEAGMLRFSRRDRLQLQWIGKVAGRPVKGPTHYRLPRDFWISPWRGASWSLIPECFAAPLIASGRLDDLAPGVIVSVPLFWRRRRITARLIEDLTKAIHSEAGKWRPN
ncbi:MAG: hypothetical protein ACK4OJ_11445 [Brevundimonas sp.]